mgnify:CR=1 FL=1
MNEKIITLSDASRVLQRSECQIYRLLGAGKLERRQIKTGSKGRPYTGVTLSSITKYIKEN